VLGYYILGFLRSVLLPLGMPLYFYSSLWQRLFIPYCDLGISCSFPDLSRFSKLKLTLHRTESQFSNLLFNLSAVLYIGWTGVAVWEKAGGPKTVGGTDIWPSGVVP